MIKNIIITILFGVCIYFIFFKKEKVKEVISKEARVLANAEVERVNKKIDKKGFEHAVIEEVENIISHTRVLDDSSKKKLDSILMLLNIKEKQIKEWRQYSTSLEDKLLAAQQSDSGFRYSDKFAHIEYIKPKDSSSNGHFNFKYDAAVNYAEYWKRDWVLGKKKHYIDFWISDTRATINGVKRIKIEPKADNIKLDINATSIYSDRLYLGGDVGLTINKARIGAGYFYDVSNKVWNPLVTMKLNVLEL